jgi:RND family efflux transporter MFP subunit
MPIESPKKDLNSLRINRTATASKASGSGKGKLFAAVGILLVVLVGLWMLLSKSLFTSAELVQSGTVSRAYASQANAVLTASGYIVASRKASVATKGTGRLIYLGVEEGSLVKKDQIIGRLDASDVQAALGQAQASLIVAKANLGNARATLENADSTVHRQRVLFRQNLASQSELTTAESQYKQALSQVASGEANIQLAERGVHSAEVQVEFTNIRAPFDGTVLTKDADVGDVMTPFGAAAGSRADLVTLADMSSLDAEIDVSETNIEQVHLGQPCEITLDAVPEKRYKGIVHMIVPTADRSKATILTKVNFVDRDARVLPEMSVKVVFMKDSSVATDTAGPKTTVPASAVTSRNGKKVVFVIHGETISETPVTLGETMGSRIEVISGVVVGDKVVLHPSEKMSSGTKIKTEE